MPVVYSVRCGSGVVLTAGGRASALVVAAVADGLITCSEYFAPDDCAAMLARFAELSGEKTAPAV
jgi:hypothetical protein